MNTATSSNERRAWVRFPCDREIVCRPQRDGTVNQWSARIRDLSRGGIQLVVDHWIVPSTVLEIQMESTNATPAQALVVQVIFAMAQPDGKWVLGCRFLRSLSEVELTTILH